MAGHGASGRRELYERFAAPSEERPAAGIEGCYDKEEGHENTHR